MLILLTPLIAHSALLILGLFKLHSFTFTLPVLLFSQPFQVLISSPCPHGCILDVKSNLSLIGVFLLFGSHAYNPWLNFLVILWCCIFQTLESLDYPSTQQAVLWRWSTLARVLFSEPVNMLTLFDLLLQTTLCNIIPWPPEVKWTYFILPSRCASLCCPINLHSDNEKIKKTTIFIRSLENYHFLGVKNTAAWQKCTKCFMKYRFGKISNQLAWLTAWVIFTDKWINEGLSKMSPKRLSNHIEGSHILWDYDFKF